MQLDKFSVGKKKGKKERKKKNRSEMRENMKRGWCIRGEN